MSEVRKRCRQVARGKLYRPCYAAWHVTRLTGYEERPSFFLLAMLG